jgi:hypothetical protein
MSKLVSQLFEFAYFPRYDDSLIFLAGMAAKEDWDFSTARERRHSILRNFLEFTFRRIQQEKKMAYTQDNRYACFNTGLVTENLEDIYGFFEQYRNPGPDSSPYIFKSFLKHSDFQLLKHFSENLPDVPNYFEDPSQLIYNPKLTLITNVDHIIQDNLDRFPGRLRAADGPELRRQLFGAIEEVKKRVKTNYKIAVPQYYRNRIQLLLPLCLTVGSPNPDLALVAQKLNPTTYTARTCLTLEMAYKNARLIVKPESNWLKP